MLSLVILLILNLKNEFEGMDNILKDYITQYR